MDVIGDLDQHFGSMPLDDSLVEGGQKGFWRRKFGDRECSGVPPLRFYFLQFQLSTVNCGPEISHGKFQTYTVHKF